ncbi:MAG TPA: SGNH/GDSL hydrolase family protein [Acidobacteriaceae bacterium]|nr:SGNH/GDSL hydrolase family protein [Acidobacteriaceae bacterium]
MRLSRKFSVFSLSLFLIAGFSPGLGTAQSQTASISWMETWAASQQAPEPWNAMRPEDTQDATIRQVFHLSVGGSMVRIRLSNAWGSNPMTFGAIHLARPVSSASGTIVAGTDTAVTFFGATSVTVPPGAEYWSDPVAFPVMALSNVAVSFYLRWGIGLDQTGHPGSRATSYYVHGNQVAALDLPGAQPIDHWYQVSGIEVPAPKHGGDVVALGDSITDGHATTTNGNDRWTDDLAERLQASPATRKIGVLNEGIGGNQLLDYGLGPDVLARFDRDVLAQAGARWVIVLEGINDVGGLTRLGAVPATEHQDLVHRVLGTYEQIVLRAHEHGLKVIGGTLTPFAGSGYYHPGPESEEDREAINAWIRTPGHFDAVVDFDKVIRDPEHPQRMLAKYDSGDHLHPSVAGYRAMADAIPLRLFR